jgi:hypothetical protein
MRRKKLWLIELANSYAYQSVAKSAGQILLTNKSNRSVTMFGRPAA